MGGRFALSIAPFHEDRMVSLVTSFVTSPVRGVGCARARQRIQANLCNLVVTKAVMLFRRSHVVAVQLAEVLDPGRGTNNRHALKNLRSS